MTGAPAPKPWIEAIHAYVPGKSAGKDGRPLIKLSANENPLGTSPKALAAREHAVIPSLYPDPDSNALRAALGEVHGRPGRPLNLIRRRTLEGKFAKFVIHDHDLEDAL